MYVCTYVVISIVEVALSMPVSNAWPERGASAVKCIKTRLRNSLGQEMMHTLMHISINGPSLHSDAATALIKSAATNWSKRKRRYKAGKAMETKGPKHK